MGSTRLSLSPFQAGLIYPVQVSIGDFGNLTHVTRAILSNTNFFFRKCQANQCYTSNTFEWLELDSAGHVQNRENLHSYFFLGLLML
jgi:hypothetical protein